MKIASVGGGPGGLFSSILLKKSDPTREITVYERNASDDTFGFGVVFSQETLDNIADADPESFGRISAEFRHWSAIDTDFLGVRERSDGHAFAALERKRLLAILGERALRLGVDVRYSTSAPALAELQRDNDLVIASDGVNSPIRTALAENLDPSVDPRSAKYVWFGTTQPFDCFTFLFVETEFGLFWAHVYPFDGERSTFIVETDEETWRRAGLDVFAAVHRKPGENDEATMAFCERIFAGHLDGHALIGNNSGWLSFTVIRNRSWSADNVALVGDAAHTAHFSIGSGTKLALEDAISLAVAVDREPSIEAALKAYEDDRQPVVASLQRSAQTSLEWFEGAARYRDLPPEQFVFQLLTRSQRVTYDNLKLRDSSYVDPRHRTVCCGWHAADVPPLQAARHGAGQPHRRLADGAVLRRRRDAHRLAPRAPRRTRGRRRRTRHDGDDLHLSGRPDHPGLPRDLERRAGGRLGAHRRLRARQQRREDRTTARARRPQGLHEGHVGGHRRPTRPRQLGDRRTVADPVPLRLRGAEGDVAGRHRRRDRRPRGVCAARRRNGFRPAGAALRARLPGLQLPVAPVEPADRRLRR